MLSLFVVSDVVTCEVRVMLQFRLRVSLSSRLSIAKQGMTFKSRKFLFKCSNLSRDEKVILVVRRGSLHRYYDALFASACGVEALCACDYFASLQLNFCNEEEKM
jgi:hypothetical protein